jgi:hypothetical protein
MPPSMRSALLSNPPRFRRLLPTMILCALLPVVGSSLISACGVFCPKCPEAPKPLPPPPPRIVEIVKPCVVPDPVIPLQPQDIPSPDAATGQVTLSPEATVRLAQSILGWKGYILDTKAKCAPLPVPR